MSIPHAPAAFDTALVDVEQQLAVFWRRGRAASVGLSRGLHPDLDPAAYGLLTILHRDGARRVTDLAASVGVGKPTVSRQIALLEELGLVAKEADPSDGRAQQVTLTGEGERQVAELKRRRHEFFAERLASWDPRELTELAEYLRRMNDALAPHH
ncbi:transcriptional regulator [Sinomonas cellulolyticus]|jgi:DNA-binding MarR family transcriptional regulator|uniref:MarR family transcriptional regulator n=1 Tax=Sinomonas cellulolyticus TaxID=2801916 RepID=A0ABS1K4X8_9MICC|nr:MULTISPECIES: MarR family transcriptional regulator [Sinomonas]MBL0706731.1 MarR family transcriptional regulator [Sinomonas cellulolyticus]GHG56360.1 transcriptional regulator [Sinomonas sp. KCTC 49339]